MAEESKKKKFKVGDLLKIKGEKEVFEVVSWFYEASFEEGAFYESTHYTVRGKTTGKIVDFVSQDDPDVQLIESKDDKKKEPKGSQKLEKKEIDMLLDLYNDYQSIDILLQSLGIDDNEYKIKSEDVVLYLKENAKMK